ncbi:hypothetical protein FNW02_26575 [Komarekiella sp. 'clone 1']|uniref:Uncharacterized protein n=1 Tax=Komarekiella delphini-convector SJRDD-AB1 TaxID=2593771 RepID=A0AA40T210_9NOST|nr:hypothetical protein [Komarekiella delphini-convector]MBD6619295.1 hypothetical protein [Komarekiella delphini-convector SJRDD-AB1]
MSKNQVKFLLNDKQLAQFKAQVVASASTQQEYIVSKILTESTPPSALVEIIKSQQETIASLTEILKDKQSTLKEVAQDSLKVTDDSKYQNRDLNSSATIEADQSTKDEQEIAPKPTQLSRVDLIERYAMSDGDYNKLASQAQEQGWVELDGMRWQVSGKKTKAVWTVLEPLEVPG